MNSMTGFGRGSAEEGGVSVEVEIGSVNRKNLDLQISLPKGYAALEENCAREIAARLHRGRAQVRIFVGRGAETGDLAFDRAAAARLLREVNDFAAEQNLREVASVEALLRISPLFRERETEADTERLRPILDAALRRALDGLVEARAIEGAHLRGALESLLADLRALVAELEPLVPEAREELARKLRAGASGLGSLSPEMEARMLQEIALYAEKSDVREEVDRLKGHLEQAAGKLGASEPVGRGLDFLCQEMAREWNTLSVKASRADINRLALMGKEKVEMLREQVQNIE